MEFEEKEVMLIPDRLRAISLNSTGFTRRAGPGNPLPTTPVSMAFTITILPNPTQIPILTHF